MQNYQEPSASDTRREHETHHRRWIVRALTVAAGLFMVIVWTTVFRVDLHNHRATAAMDPHLLGDRYVARAFPEDRQPSGRYATPDEAREAARTSIELSQRIVRGVDAHPVLVWTFRVVITVPAFLVGAIAFRCWMPVYAFFDTWLVSDLTRFTKTRLGRVVSNAIIVTGGIGFVAWLLGWIATDAFLRAM